MAKSMRSKREKRLRAIRREIVEPIYEKKEAAKLAAQEAALNAPKLPVRPTKNKNDDIATAAMELITNAAANRAEAAAADMGTPLNYSPLSFDL
ncbi:hypothetical protein RJ639_015809 [Escallonia herrerae]|uniref:Uncharacterized protein n=1 Tax=Escallonia herrerae TaxID=1293975 RepID=A0AA89AJ04_9ASTE|nr:hypothetical protein RJ639_015809 [Escallonia herrerae]